MSNLDLPLPKQAILLLQSYVTTDLYQIFRLHFKSLKSLQSYLLNFMQKAIGLFKSNIWKIRSQAGRIGNIVKGSLNKTSKTIILSTNLIYVPNVANAMRCILLHNV